eukprot:TRINITY_DN11952_c0_g2_i1.p1 TRINITY_DN11952_c0_g2~~TRINITY_DN11952_c0_g2_i1.p1  ORF type:complete len:253 (+),score=54.91 TRINITY_DN11952_c0_g2_i1:57-815(+)
MLNDVKAPLVAFRSLGRMLLPQLRQGELSHDMVDAMLVQGDRMKDVVDQIQQALLLPQTSLDSHRGPQQPQHYFEDTSRSNSSSSTPFSSPISLPSEPETNSSSTPWDRSHQPLLPATCSSASLSSSSSSPCPSLSPSDSLSSSSSVSPSSPPPAPRSSHLEPQRERQQSPEQELQSRSHDLHQDKQQREAIQDSLSKEISPLALSLPAPSHPPLQQMLPVQAPSGVTKRDGSSRQAAPRRPSRREGTAVAP